MRRVNLPGMLACSAQRGANSTGQETSSCSTLPCQWSGSLQTNSKQGHFDPPIVCLLFVFAGVGTQRVSYIQLSNESVLTTVTVTAAHSDLFLLLNLTLLSNFFCICVRGETNRLPGWCTQWKLTSVLTVLSTEVSPFPQGLPRNGGKGCSCWSCSPRAAGICSCIAQARGTRRRHSYEASLLQGKEEENPTQSVSANCMG